MIDKVQSFLTYWEKKYRHVWEADRDAYIRRYEKAQKPLSSFEADITRYLQVGDRYPWLGWCGAVATRWRARVEMEARPDWPRQREPRRRMRWTRSSQFIF